MIALKTFQISTYAGTLYNQKLTEEELNLFEDLVKAMKGM